MDTLKKILLVVILCTITLYANSQKKKSRPVVKPDSVLRIMKKVTGWQWNNLETEGWKWPKTDWTNGAMYAGMLAYSGITNDSSSYAKLVKVAADNQWNTGPLRFFADDYCVGQMYSQLYSIYREPEMIKNFRALGDSIISRPHDESLYWKNKIYLREWAWCDAMFMGPPALAYLSTATGDLKYLRAASGYWWKTTEFLYDKKEHLYYRDSRFFDQREENGKKVFWSRGNGWVMGGLVRMLSNMPENFPDRKRFEKLFKEMAYRIAPLQTDDGTWHASLLDPDNYHAKESSGTGFYIYALAWGVNNGLLSGKDFKPVIQKGWEALVGCVQDTGKIGFVQLPAAEPGKATAEDTATYGTGAFLLAGSEVYKLNKSVSKEEKEVLIDWFIK